MRKHPSAFKLCGSLAEKVKTVKDEAMTLYEGRMHCCTLLQSSSTVEIVYVSPD